MMVTWNAARIHEYCCVVMSRSFSTVGAATASVLRVRKLRVEPSMIRPIISHRSPLTFCIGVALRTVSICGLRGWLGTFGAGARRAPARAADAILSEDA